MVFYTLIIHPWERMTLFWWLLVCCCCFAFECNMFIKYFIIHQNKKNQYSLVTCRYVIQIHLFKILIWVKDHSHQKTISKTSSHQKAISKTFSHGKAISKTSSHGKAISKTSLLPWECNIKDLLSWEGNIKYLLSWEGNINDLLSWEDSLTVVFICKTLFNDGKLQFTNADLSVFVFNYTLTINLPC